MDIGTAVRDASCDFTDHGTLALTEQIIEPKNLQVNLQLCKSNLLDSWESLQMRAGAGAPFPASFDDYVMSYLGETIANGIANNGNNNELQNPVDLKKLSLSIDLKFASVLMKAN